MSESISKIKARAAKSVARQLMSDLLGDVAIGITRIGDDYGLKINLLVAPPESVVLPNNVDGVPVRFEVTGPVTKRPDEDSLESV
ncbi:MAG: hypothetical protein U0941_08655 [Planctomycetaceae bacterium]